MRKIGKAKALELMAEAVGYMGADYVYPPGVDGAGCRYVHGDEDESGEPTPSCIVGHALYLAGLEIPKIAELDQVGTIAAASYLVPALTGPAVRVLRAAQDRQDGGATWGKALEAAKVEAAARE